MFDIDFSYLSAEGVSKANQLKSSDIAKDKERIKETFRKVSDLQADNKLVWATLPFDMQSRTAEIKRAAIGYRKYENFVVLGMGGSARGVIALKNALLSTLHNGLSRSKRRAPKLYIEEDICPNRFSELLGHIDPCNTVFNIITKSGETIEVMAQFLLIKKMLEDKLGANAKDHIVVTTTIGSGRLYEIAVQEGYRIFDIPKGLGGRFSTLCAIGLLPLASVGADIDEILAGARDACKMCKSADMDKNLALRAAYTHYFYMEKNKNTVIFMPYSCLLKGTTGFFCQLWAESLGKKVLGGKGDKRVGQIPVPAEGVSDQHSLLQLMMDGPDDKLTVFLKIKDFGVELKMPSSVPKGLEYLAGLSMGELLNIEHDSTVQSLAKAGRPSYTIVLPKMNERVIGQLLQHFMFQVAYAGELLGVNTYDQPGVEHYKMLTLNKLKETLTSRSSK